MKHLPLFFDLVGRRVVVVGEGAAADRRADLARSAGAEVQRIVLPSVQASDFRGAAAAFIATGDADRDAAAQRAARSAGVPVNVADRPALCDFILPAIVDRDDVVVAISTAGASPTLATVLRGRIEAALPERLGAVARLAATFRAQVNALIIEPARRRMRLTINVATKLNRTHLIHGEVAYLLPCLGRLEIDRQGGIEQTVSVEDSTGCMHGSRGLVEPASPAAFIGRSPPVSANGTPRAARPSS